MKKVLIVIGIIFGVVVFLTIITAASLYGFVKGSYNTITTDRQTAISINADLDAQLQRRFDLINQTVGATKGALAHEQKIFDDIAKQQAAFTQAHDSGNVQGELNANAAVGTSIGQALRGYFVVQQQYPNEQALQFVQNLQTNIDGSENRISVARQRYNDSVKIYNTELSVFPTNWLNGQFFHFQSMPYYRNDVESKKAPKVDLGQ